MGYAYTGRGTKFLVRSFDVPVKSNYRVPAECDGCGKRRMVKRCDYRSLCPHCVRNTDEFKALRSEISKSYWTEDARKQASEWAIERFKSPITRSRMSNSAKLRFANPEERAHLSEIRRLWWASVGRARYSGCRNWRWKPTISDRERWERRKLPEYKEWRRSVYKRDDFTCVACGARGVKLNAHHIANFADNPDLRLVVENGVTLCADGCHREFHHTYGLRHTTRQQFDEFLLYKRKEVTTNESQQLETSA